MTRSLSSFPNVIFTIGGTAFTLTPLQYLTIYKEGANSYVCYSVFLPMDAPDSQGNLYWVFGDYFLYRFVTIYDIRKNRVGFATSISYNFTQSVDPSLFSGSATAETTTTTSAAATTEAFDFWKQWWEQYYQYQNNEN